jgi:hypothetical protein
VGHDEQGAVRGPLALAQELDDAVAAGAVEIAGRLGGGDPSSSARRSMTSRSAFSTTSPPAPRGIGRSARPRTCSSPTASTPSRPPSRSSAAGTTR